MGGGLPKPSRAAPQKTTQPTAGSWGGTGTLPGTTFRLDWTCFPSPSMPLQYCVHRTTTLELSLCKNYSFSTANILCYILINESIYLIFNTSLFLISLLENEFLKIFFFIKIYKLIIK